jgi:hypothetical protein
VVRWLREPLLHFVVIGLAIFLGAQAWRAANDQHRIVVTPERAAELTRKYRLQFGASPTPAEAERFIDAYVREEALYREAVAMGLDRDDEIVRRRLAQKIEFLLADRSLPAEPDDAALRRWFESHAADYATPVRTTFSHLYFSADGVGEGPSRVRAAEALALLRGGAAPDAAHADPFPDQGAYTGMSRDEARRLFGDSELARAIDTAPVGAWSGPYRSGYGWHLVHVDVRDLAGRPPFEQVRERVREDYLRGAQAAANARAIQRLRDRYTVVRRDLEAGR